jgi:putative transcriptional regulator
MRNRTVRGEPNPDIDARPGRFRRRIDDMQWLPIASLVFVVSTGMPRLSAQSMQPDDLAVGKLLVASPDLPDPNFARTVVLLVEYEEDGVVGLIVNRRSKVPISRVLEDVQPAKERADPVYAGGPVGRTELLALLRSHDKPSDAKHVVGDIFLVTSKDLLEKILASSKDSNVLRLYLGYSGWTMEQLRHEVDLGAWYIFRGDPAAVFDSEPDSLWSRLIRETELRIAMNRELRPPAR